MDADTQDLMSLKYFTPVSLKPLIFTVAFLDIKKKKEILSLTVHDLLFFLCLHPVFSHPAQSRMSTFMYSENYKNKS